jgi:hypothetical protein
MPNKPKTACDERQMNLFGRVDEVPRKPATEASVEELALPEVDDVEFNLAGAGANTMFGYLYRDGDNYKRFKDVILKGRLSRADIHKMFDAVFDYRLRAGRGLRLVRGRKRSEVSTAQRPTLRQTQTLPPKLLQ